MFEATDPVGDVGFGWNPFESMCKASAFVPCPMCRDEAIQRLVLASSFQQSVSRSLVVTTLDVERVEPGLEDQRCENRHPGLEEVDEGLV